MPDKDEAYVGEAVLSLIYGNVRIHIVAAYDDLRKVDSACTHHHVRLMLA